MFLKWNFVWKHVENGSEYLIDQIGCKISKFNIFPIFPKLQKKIIFKNCPILSTFMECFKESFSAFFRYTETVFLPKYRNTENWKKITETEITEPKSYRTKLFTNSMFLKWNFVWKYVENVSEYQTDQIGWKNIKIQHFTIFSSLQKNNF